MPWKRENKYEVALFCYHCLSFLLILLVHFSNCKLLVGTYSCLKTSWLKSCNITRSTRCYWCEASNDLGNFFKSTGRRKKKIKGKTCFFFFFPRMTHRLSFVVNVSFQKVNVAEKNNLWHTPWCVGRENILGRHKSATHGWWQAREARVQNMSTK